MPVTFEAAAKAPITSGCTAAYRSSRRASAARSTPPRASSGTLTTSADDSRHGSRLEWCSCGPTSTTARFESGVPSGSGASRPSAPTSLLAAPVAPRPAKSTTSAWRSARCTRQLVARAIAPRASSRKQVVCRPAALVVVCVLASVGSTQSSTRRSTPRSARPCAAQSQYTAARSPSAVGTSAPWPTSPRRAAPSASEFGAFPEAPSRSPLPTTTSPGAGAGTGPPALPSAAHARATCAGSASASTSGASSGSPPCCASSASATVPAPDSTSVSAFGTTCASGSGLGMGFASSWSTTAPASACSSGTESAAGAA
mmetsp:Transcript_6359/g.25662  ORF Transcript_6359/g.25662 Transcript_6359/m.25662 type:complete len:314 (+) Transcript_6359:3625-4566(+)